MKGGQNLAHLQQKKKEQAEEAWIHQPICCVCGKKCEGYYSRHGDTGTCSGDCMKKQDAKPKYPGFSEEEYLMRQSERLDH